MSKKRRRFPIRLKTIIMIVVFGLLLAEIAMVYYSVVLSNNNKKSYKNAATSLSNTVALMINNDDVTQLKNDIALIYDQYSADNKPVRSKIDGTAEYTEYLAKYNEVKTKPYYIRIQKILLDVKKANEDTEGIYLAYVDYDNKLCIYMVYDTENELYPVGVVDELYEEDYPLINNHKLGFVASIYKAEVENTYLVTAGAPVLDESGDNVICYALVDISLDKVRSKQANSITRLFIYLISTVILLCVVGILVINFILIRPVKILQTATKSYDASNPEKTHEIFTALDVKVHDEFADLAESMKKMESDVYNKMNELVTINKELVESQETAKKMTEIANKDALTGVRNKAAYDNQIKKINEQIKNKEKLKFGIVMIDLNYLKTINDEYGHNSGDTALIKLCNIVCTIFAHSPVFRVGGDEFVVILKNRDYNNSDKLINEFKEKIRELASDDDLLPAEKVSAAIGYSKYNPKKDASVEDVFERADKAMYSNKHRMKNEG